MKLRIFVCLIAAVTLVACASSSYRKVIPGIQTFGQLQINVGEGWTIAPSSDTPEDRNTTRTYTRNGLTMERLIMIPGVNDGEAVLVKEDAAAGAPVFRSDLTPDDLEGLIASSLSNVFSSDNATVDTNNRRPYGFGANSGVTFDVSISTAGGSNYRGVAGTLIADDRLYVAMYLAAYPEIYNENIELGRDAVESMTIRVRTIKQGGF
jgi:hypothetical protein